MSRRKKRSPPEPVGKPQAAAATQPRLWPLVVSSILFVLWLVFLAAMAFAA